MKFVVWAGLAVAWLLTLSQASETPQSTGIFASDFPPCILDCAGRDILSSPCTTKDCACKLDAAFDDASSCIQSSCGFQYLLIARNISNSACTDERRSRADTYFACNLSLGVITLVVTIARLCFKRFFGATRRLAPDDWIILSALLVGAACAVINWRGLVLYGLGRDIWTIPTHDISTFAEYLFILEPLYLTSVTLIKTALLVFYLSIFPSFSVSPWTRRLIWTSIAFNILLGIACVLLAAFQCQPVPYYWKKDLDRQAHGTCIDKGNVAWVSASVNLALDLCIILLPISGVWNLKMHWKKKLGVVVMFLAGTLMTLASIMRTVSIPNFASSVNMTWDYYDLLLWSTVEVNVGILGSNLPTMRLIVLRIAPKLFGSDDATSPHLMENSHMATRRHRRLSSVETCVEDVEGLYLTTDSTKPKAVHVEAWKEIGE